MAAVCAKGGRCKGTHPLICRDNGCGVEVARATRASREELSTDWLAVFGRELRAEEKRIEKEAAGVHPCFQNRLKELAGTIGLIAEVVERTVKKTVDSEQNL